MRLSACIMVRAGLTVLFPPGCDTMAEIDLLSIGSYTELPGGNIALPQGYSSLLAPIINVRQTASSQDSNNHIRPLCSEHPSREYPEAAPGEGCEVATGRPSRGRGVRRWIRLFSADSQVRGVGISAPTSGHGSDQRSLPVLAAGQRGQLQARQWGLRAGLQQVWQARGEGGLRGWYCLLR